MARSTSAKWRIAPHRAGLMVELRLILTMIGGPADG